MTRNQYDYPLHSVLDLIFWKTSLLRAHVAQERIRRQYNVKSRLNRIKSLRNSKVGPALVVANGTTAGATNVKSLSYFIKLGGLFTVNNYFLRQDLGLVSNYHFICDRGYWSSDSSKIAYRKLLNSFQEEKSLTIIQPDHLPDYHTETRNLLYIRKNPLPTLSKGIDVTRVSGLANNTAFFAIATALYLGFSPVYVIGLSLDYYQFASYDSKIGWGLKPHHFYEEPTTSLYTWQHRDTISRILNYNLFLIESLRRFQGTPVTLVSEKPISQCVRTISNETFNLEMEKQFN